MTGHVPGQRTAADPLGTAPGTTFTHQQLAAIARAASSVADAGSLAATLGVLAEAVRSAAGIAAAQVLTLHADGHLTVAGMAGFATATEHFSTRLAECRRRGAELVMLRVVASRHPAVVLHRKPLVMADPRWEPIHELLASADWDSFACVPMIVRDRPVGVLTAFYPPRADPGPTDLEFLAAMADQAAMAVDHAELLAASREDARRRERERIARDLHDSVVQQVFSLRLHARALAGYSSPPGGHRLDGDRVHQAADEMFALATTALADLRDLIFQLRPADLAEHGLSGAVRLHARAVADRTGLRVHVDHPAERLDLDPDLEQDLYRIAQEALHNVVKHADASRVAIRLGAAGDGRVVLEVADDGRGCVGTPWHPRGLGLTSMRERAERWGGTLQVAPAPGGGTRVTAEVPRTARPPALVPVPATVAAASASAKASASASVGVSVDVGIDVDVGVGGRGMTGDPTTAGDTITVMLVDDHAVVRRGLRTYLHEVPGIRIVQEAGDGHAAVQLLGLLAAEGRLPDVALVDIQMPRLSGVEAARLIARLYPSVRVVILSSFGEIERVHAALEAGAVGYLLKDAEPDEIVTAVRTAASAQREVYLDPLVARRLTRRLVGPASGLSGLTPRERDILALVATGCSNRQIADQLRISERTARTHVSNVLAKMHLTSRTQAALVAIQEGLVTLPDSADTDGADAGTAVRTLSPRSPVSPLSPRPARDARLKKVDG